MTQLILIRHGQSQWNLENRFTGFHDIGLTKTGLKEAAKAAKLIKKEGCLLYTSPSPRDKRQSRMPSSA